jgi:hypothetical protein
MIRGMHFWRVESSIKIHIDLLFKIEINQLWKGAAPNFSISLNTLMESITWPRTIDIITPVRKKIDAHLCTRKYFIVFSRARPDSEDIIGRNISILSSRHTHIIKGEDLLMATSNTEASIV